MVRQQRLRRLWASLESYGAHPGETDIQRSKRLLVVGYYVFGSLARVGFAAVEFGEDRPAMGLVDVVAIVVSVVSLTVLRFRPGWLVGLVNIGLLLGLAEVLAQTVIVGGLVESDLVILFGMLVVLAALIVLSLKAAVWWFSAFVLTVFLAAVLPTWIEPVHSVEGSPGGIAGTIVVVTIFVFAELAYFVRQRDRLQTESDDLLHNILPDEIAARLKADKAMIADDHEAASVLFADVVDFTPMSAGMSPPELVGLLNAVFTTFDGFVAELGLEKIKTVGDEYMVAAGVPTARADHALAIAELALAMRDHTEHNRFDGHAIRLRIGLNSGPVVAGVVGTHKFAYDLWGDVVNTASRMESEGVPGSIQLTQATYELIRDRFVCEPRGVVPVKGKGNMGTYFLIAQRADAGPAAALVRP